MSRVSRVAITVAVLSCVSPFVHADVKLPAIFTSNMVLQRDTRLPVWGTADAGEAVKVTFGTQEKSTTAAADGRWKVELDAVPASAQPAELRVTGNNTVTFSNVLVGEVWVCSGQSNMEWALRNTNDFTTAIAEAQHPNIRLFTVKKKVSQDPLNDVEGAWVECSPQTVPGFSAVAYYFGREVQQKLDVPVGLINSSWGGTPAEAWTPRDAMEADEQLKPIIDRQLKAIKDLPVALEKYKVDLEKWKAMASTQPAATQPNAPAALRRPQEPNPHNQNAPAHLYNGMIHPIVPYATRGAIWYQGESNAGRANQYHKLLSTLIESWRGAWGRTSDEYAFYIVQLANFMAPTDDPNKASNWAQLREAQSDTARSVPHTGVAVTIDIGDEKDIHPRNKLDVGKRLAALALNRTYGLSDVVASGPTWKKMEVVGSVATLSFDDVAGGLIAKGAEDGKTPGGFAISGADKKFVHADAKISEDGQTVTVSSEQVTTPTAVRYGWADNPTKANLYNHAGLPASPFRTDE